jgi:OAA-family lectin sugar binding domain
MQNDDDPMTDYKLPACVDFRMFPPVTVNTQVKQNDGRFIDDHVILGNDQQITIAFFVSASNLAQNVSLTMTALVSRLEPSEGFSPISLTVDGRTIVTDYTMPGGGYKGETSTFMIPPDLLTVGKNSVTIQVAPSARSYFWLYDVTVGSGAFQKPKTMDNVLFAYQTSHAWSDFSQWHPAAQLAFYIDCGEDALPASLSWRDQKGNAGSISLQGSMSTFTGYYQRANEGPIAYRGAIAKRIPLSEVARNSLPCQIFTYQAEHSWGGSNAEWHRCADLVFCIHSGEGDTIPASLNWRDQKGNAGSISFQSDMSTFYGYYQRVGEGPISYQGRLIRREERGS